MAFGAFIRVRNFDCLWIESSPLTCSACDIIFVYRYEERIEAHEVLAESFAENYEDAKQDLGYDINAQSKLYEEQEVRWSIYLW